MLFYGPLLGVLENVRIMIKSEKMTGQFCQTDEETKVLKIQPQVED